MIIGQNFPDFWTIPKLPESVREVKLNTSKKYQIELGLIQKGHLNVGNLSAGLVVQVPYANECLPSTKLILTLLFPL